MLLLRRSTVLKIKSMKELNEKLCRVTRVVVHPKYRTIGASVKLLRESLPLCGKPYVEMIAVMARYNPFAEHAGLRQRLASPRFILQSLRRLLNLRGWGSLPICWLFREYNLEKLEGQVDRVKEILLSFKYPYNRRIAGDHGNYKMSDYRVLAADCRKGGACTCALSVGSAEST